jgi:hypothetical protein
MLQIFFLSSRSRMDGMKQDASLPLSSLVEIPANVLTGCQPSHIHRIPRNAPFGWPAFPPAHLRRGRRHVAIIRKLSECNFIRQCNCHCFI